MERIKGRHLKEEYWGEDVTIRKESIQKIGSGVGGSDYFPNYFGRKKRIYEKLEREKQQNGIQRAVRLGFDLAGLPHNQN